MVRRCFRKLWMVNLPPMPDQSSPVTRILNQWPLTTYYNSDTTFSVPLTRWIYRVYVDWWSKSDFSKLLVEMMRWKAILDQGFIKSTPIVPKTEGADYRRRWRCLGRPPATLHLASSKLAARELKEYFAPSSSPEQFLKRSAN